MADQELSIQDKCKLAAGFIIQSPPGEVNDVINDIRSIISDDTALMPHVIPALRSYNLTQLHVVEHPSSSTESPAHSSLLSDAAVLPGSHYGGSESDGIQRERYVDAEGKRSFAFDHVTLAFSDYESYTLPEEEETFRSALAKSLSAYTKNHFPAGHSSVNCSQHPLNPPAPSTSVEATEPTTSADSDLAATATISVVADTKAAVPAEPAVSTLEVSESATEPPKQVTDVINEQINAGAEEPAPTPAHGESIQKDGEVVQESSLDIVDEKVEELKEEEEQGEMAHGEASDEEPVVVEVSKQGEGIGSENTPIGVEESQSGEEETAVSAPPLPSAPVERKQERIDNPIYTLEIVGNRYNPSNFWTGRWRTQWVVDQAAKRVTGTIQVDVHYYEQGNVQLATKHSAFFPCPKEESGGQSIASQIVTTISKIETNYHLELNDVYGELGDKAFRALRRALPITRQKMEWEKISGYGLSSELTQARA